MLRIRSTKLFTYSFQDLDWSEVPESAAPDDLPGHPPVPQHPKDQHQHQVTVNYQELTLKLKYEHQVQSSEFWYEMIIFHP